MMQIFVTIILFCICSQSLPGQCPDRDFLWKRIIYLRDSSDVPQEKQLAELSGYLSKIAQCPQKGDSTNVLLLQRIGGLYAAQNDFYNAIYFTRKSIEMETVGANSEALNKKQSIRSYWNLQAMYDSLKLTEKKIAALDSCIYISNRLNNVDYLTGAIEKRISQTFDRGDYFRCIYYAKLGESVVHTNFNTIKNAAAWEAYYFNRKIDVLISSGDLEQAENLLKQKINEFEKSKRKENPAALYGLYGTINRKKKNAASALEYYKKCFYYNNKINYAVGCSEALNNIGFVYSDLLSQHKPALKFYLKALKYADANEALNTLGNIANLYVRSGNFDSAFYYFQKAFDQAEPGLSENSLLKKKDIAIDRSITAYLSDLILDKGDAWLAKYKKTNDRNALHEAIKVYKAADAFFDQVRNVQSEIQSKLFWKANSRRLYEHAIEVCYIINDPAAAFYFFEKSRSVLLNEQINEQKAMTDDELARHAQAKKTVMELENILQATVAETPANRSAQQQLLAARQQLETISNSVKNKQSSFIHVNDTTSVPISQVKNIVLANHDLLLEIFTGDSAVYILSISKKELSFTRVNKFLYDSLTTGYIAFLTNPELLNKNFSGFSNIAYSLFQLIFHQITLSTVARIIISPDGKSFPFESLITNNNNQQPAYFLFDYTCSYTYSAKYLTTAVGPNDKHENSVLGFAPINFNDSFHLATLPGSDISLKNINNYFTGINFIAAEATKNNFLNNFFHYPIIQLYTHASDTSSNNEPVVYFTDSKLLLSQVITTARPVTQLVVLSACETANGKLYQGEGVFSFNRAFASIGIPNAVSNLWIVENTSTYRITELFYKYLADGFPTDIALQKAKIEFVKTAVSREKTLPFFWAGSILTGKVDTFKPKDKISWILVTLAGIILLSTGLVIRSRYTRKNKLVL